MRKLIKRYLAGNIFDAVKFTPPKLDESIPNTGNIGGNALGIDWSKASGAEFQKAKDMIAGPTPSTIEAINAIGGGTLKLVPKLNFFGNLYKGMGGTSGLVSLGANIGNSLLPKRITSKATDTINGVFDIAKNIPGPIGMYATAGLFLFNAVDSLGASKLATLTKNLDIEDTLARTGGGYGDFMADWDEASALSGQNAGLFTPKGSLNNKIWDTNRLMSVLLQIMGNQKNNELLTALMGDRWNERIMMDMNGGLGNVSFGRLGLKIEVLDKVHAIMDKPKVVDTLTEFLEEVPEFKEGGKMNVIPEGSLHARLHHMENADGLTKKGIPVVSIAEGGELEQLAEIELNEIIFRLEVTQELEKLMEDGSDNAAIEAGKLLVKEIFENTDDRTGLIKLLEPEKKEPTTEDIVKNHQVFLKGGTIKSNKTIEQLVDYAIQVNPLFVQRIGPNMGYALFDDEKGVRRKGTHLLGYAERDGKYVVFPNIQMKEGRLQYIPKWEDAFDEAWKTGNTLSFDNLEDAELFTLKYKDSKQWKHHFDLWKQRYD